MSLVIITPLKWMTASVDIVAFIDLMSRLLLLYSVMVISVLSVLSASKGQTRCIGFIWVFSLYPPTLIPVLTERYDFLCE